MMWGTLFLVGTVGVGLFVLFRCRGILVRAKRPATGMTLVCALVGCVVMPIAGGFAGCAIGAQRGAANIYDEIDPGRAVIWAIEQGAAEVKSELGLAEDAPIAEVEQLRSLAASKASGDSTDIEELLERLWWKAVHEAVDKAPPKLTWGQVMTQAEERLKAKVREELPDVGGKLRTSSWITLGIFLAVAILAFGGALFYTRRRASQP